MKLNSFIMQTRQKTRQHPVWDNNVCAKFHGIHLIGKLIGMYTRTTVQNIVPIHRKDLDVSLGEYKID